MKNRIGIIGGGQLGRMLAFEAKKMGFHVTVLDPTPKGPASQVADEQIVANYDDEDATKKLASVSDFITIEIEHINTDILQKLSKSGIPVNPSPETVTMIKDKYNQKIFLRKNKIPTADFIEIKSEDDIKIAGKKFGYPLILKAKHGAFDGRGNAFIKKESDIKPSFKKLTGKELYLEKYIHFKKELAIMIARSTTEEIVPYPVVETIHENNICHIVKSPAQVDKKIMTNAKNLGMKVMKHLKGAGVFGIEMFLTKDNKVLINEIAPRVHNSGHHTIEANITNQFEQHIRAITGLPLGNTEMITPAAVMINILGDRYGKAEVKNLDKVLKKANTFVHIYGKHETRKQRKMGHITVLGKTMTEAVAKAVKARRILKI